MYGYNWSVLFAADFDSYYGTEIVAMDVEIVKKSRSIKFRTIKCDINRDKGENFRSNIV